MKVKDFKKLFRGTFDIYVPKLGTIRSDNEDLDDRIIDEVDYDMYDGMIVYVKEEKDADKMFEELGYLKYSESEQCVVYEQKFLNLTKMIYVSVEEIYKVNNKGSKPLTAKEAKAALMKLKEKGWLGDESKV